MGCAKNFWWTKNHYNQRLIFCKKALSGEIFFSVFYNNRKGSGITLLQSNVRKIYADPNTVLVSPYDFLMPQATLLCQLRYFLCSFYSTTGGTDIISPQSNARKNFHTVIILQMNGYNFFCLQKIYAALKKIPFFILCYRR